MKKLLTLLPLYLICGAALFSFTASAYIDPSVATYIIQIVAGIVIVAGTGLAFYFRKLKRALKRKNQDDSATTVSNFDNQEPDEFEFEDDED